jgi:tetratricopeptide (TPR) repeat protein
MVRAAIGVLVLTFALCVVVYLALPTGRRICFLALVKILVFFVVVLPRYLRATTRLAAIAIQHLLRRSGAAEDLPSGIVGRYELRRCLLSLMRDPSVGAIQIHGKAGVGKSAILGWLARQIPADHAGFSASMRGSDYADVFTRLGIDIPPVASGDANRLAIDRFLRGLGQPAILLLDDYPEEDALDFLTDWLLTESVRMGIRVKLVIALREPHQLAAPVVKLEIKPLNYDETRAFIAERLCTDREWIPESILHCRQIHFATEGNPKLLELLMTNRELWNEFIRQPDRPTKEYFDAGMRSICSSLGSSGTEALRVLSCLTALSRFLDDSLLQSVVPDWGRVQTELHRRNIVKLEENGIHTVHDMVASHVHAQEMTYEQKQRCHGSLARYFFERGNETGSDSDLFSAIGHAVMSGDASVIRLVGPHAFDRLKWRSRYMRLDELATRASRVFADTGDPMEARLLYERAWAALMLGRYVSCAELAEHAVRRSREVGDQVVQAESLWLQGEGLRMQGRYAEALQKCDESKSLFAEKGLAGSDIVLGPIWASWNRVRILTSLGRLDEAWAELRSSEGLRRGIAIVEVRGSFLCAEGMIHLARGEIDDAKNCFDQALTVCIEGGDLYWEAESRNLLAQAELLRGETGRAKMLCEQAMEIHRRLGNADRRCDGVRILAESALHDGRITEAISLLAQAIPALFSAGNMRDWAFAKLALASSTLALLYEESEVAAQGLLDLLGELDEIEQVSRQTGDDLPRVRCLRLQAEILRLKGCGQDARKLYEDLISHCDKVGYVLEGAHARLGWAACYRSLGSMATRRYREALAIYSATGHKWGEALCVSILNPVPTQHPGASPLLDRRLAHVPKDKRLYFPLIIP